MIALATHCATFSLFRSMTACVNLSRQYGRRCSRMWSKG